MGVPTSEVGYTAAIPRREDHEVHKDQKKKFCLCSVLVETFRYSQIQFLFMSNNKLNITQLQERCVKVTGGCAIKWKVVPPLANVKCYKILRTWKQSDISFYKTVRCSLKYVQLAGSVDRVCTPFRLQRPGRRAVVPALCGLYKKCHWKF